MFVVVLFEITLNVILESLSLILKLYFFVCGQQTRVSLLSYTLPPKQKQQLIKWVHFGTADEMGRPEVSFFLRNNF
jgi:hypothetical protein